MAAARSWKAAKGELLSLPTNVSDLRGVRCAVGAGRDAGVAGMLGLAVAVAVGAVLAGARSLAAVRARAGTL